jgi:hypothetical protein
LFVVGGEFARVGSSGEATDRVTTIRVMMTTAVRNPFSNPGVNSEL